MTSDKRTFHVHPNLETSEEEPTPPEDFPLEPQLRVNPAVEIPRPPPMPVYVNARPDYLDRVPELPRSFEQELPRRSELEPPRLFEEE